MNPPAVSSQPASGRRQAVAIAAAVATAWLPAPADAAGPPARIGRAWYEVQRQAIIVPFTGAPPKAYHFVLKGDHHYYELVGARLADGGVQHQPVGGPLVRYTMAPRGAGTVRISYELTFDAEPSIRLDAQAHRFEIFPFGRELRSNEPAVRVPRALVLPVTSPKPDLPRPSLPKRPAPRTSVKPAPSLAQPALPRPPALPEVPKPPLPSVRPAGRTVFYTPRLPRNLVLPTPKPATALLRPNLEGGGLVVPFQGAAPGYKARLFRANPRWMYFEFEGSGLSIEGKRFGVTEDPTIEAWMYTQPAPNKVRLYLRLRKTAPIVGEVREEDGVLRFYSPANATTVPPSARPTAVPEPTAPSAAPSEPAPPAEPKAPADPDEPAEQVGPMMYPRPDSAE